MEEPKTMNEQVVYPTSEDVNQRIRRETEENVKFYAKHPEFIRGRLRELEEEWDIGKTLQTNASALGLFGIVLSLLGKRRFLFIPALMSLFLLQHGLRGWCPPLFFFRNKGIRTKEEILREKNLLKAIRGDYDALYENQQAEPLNRVDQVFRAFDE